jgi:hypothetical protein
MRTQPPSTLTLRASFTHRMMPMFYSLIVFLGKIVEILSRGQFSGCAFENDAST